MDDAFARFQADLNALPVSGAPAAPMMPPMMPGQPFMPPMGMPPAMYPPAAMPYTDYSQTAAATAAAADYNQAGYSAADYGVDYGTAGYDYYDYTGQTAMQQAAMGEGTSGQGSGKGMLASIRNAQGASDRTSTGKPKKEEKRKPPKQGVVREAAGKRWRDPTLDEWPENDFRIFVGDLGNECNDDTLGKAFQKYPSFAKAKIVKDKRTKKTKGFGFVSFLDSTDFAKALKEMNGKYIGNRPCKLRKSTWDERNAHLKNKK